MGVNVPKFGVGWLLKLTSSSADDGTSGSADEGTQQNQGWNQHQAEGDRRIWGQRDAVSQPFNEDCKPGGSQDNFR